MFKKVKTATVLLCTLSLLFTPIFSSPVLCAMSKAEERKAGEKYATSVLGEVGSVKDPYVKEYLDEIVERLVVASDSREFKIKIYVLSMTTVNAFAMPGGHIFLTTGLINAMDNENELAGVIAHEMGHVEGRHIAFRLDKYDALSWLAIASMVAAVIVVAKGEPEAGMGLAYLGSAGAQAQALKYSRVDEQDADHRAQLTLEAAGYPVSALVDFMDTMRRASAVPDEYPGYLLTHPRPADRATYLSGKLGEEKPPTYIPDIADFRIFQARNAAWSPKAWSIGKIIERAKENPDDAASLFGAALIQSALGKYQAASRLMETAALLWPGNIEIAHERAVLAMRMGETSEGIATLEELTGKKENFIPAMRDLGWAYLEVSEDGKALAIFEKLSEIDSEWKMLPYQLGMALGRVGREGEAHLSLAKFYKARNRNLAMRHLKHAEEKLPEGEQKKEAKKLLKKLEKEGEKK